MELPIIAVYDANILYSAPLRDLLIRLALEGLVRCKWTEAIHAEWIRNVIADRPDLSAARLAKTRQQMDAAVRDCLLTGYEERIEALTLPDPDDRHVLAAAIHAEATVIVTFNRKDFPAGVLAAYGIEAQHPDDFVMNLLRMAPHLVCAAVKKQRESLRNPSKTVEDLLATLKNVGLTQTVDHLQPFVEIL